MKRFFLLFIGLLVTYNFSFAQSTSNFNDFYNVDRIQDIRVNFKQNNWKEILDSLKLYGDDMLIANVFIGGSHYKNVGIAYKGSKSFRPGGDRNSFRIKLNYIEKEQNHQGYKQVQLSNALRDPSMVREVLGFEIARKYMQAPKANYARIYVNGEYRGLFTNIEYVDDNFLESRFGSSDGSFFKCSAPSPEEEKNMDEDCKKKISGTLVYEDEASCYLNNYELKSESGWDDLIELTKTLNSDIEKTAELLDIDQVLWMLAFNNVLVNLNSYLGDYSENFYLYKDKFGRFVPIVRDMNLCFGSYKNYKFKASSLELKGLQELDPFLHADNDNKPLVSQILKDPYYSKLYTSHIKTILEENFLNGQYEERAKKLQDLIRSDVERDRYKYYKNEQFAASMTATVGKRSKIPGIVELMEKRVSYLKKHPKIRGFAPEITEVEVLNRAKFERGNLSSFRINATVNKIPKKVRVYYRFDSSEVFKMAFMNDDGKSYDREAGDGVFGIEINPEEGEKEIEYYVVAENAAGLSHFPVHYMFEPLGTNLTELNK